MPKHSARMNLLVLKTPDIERAANFYRLIGLSFERHQHGSGPSHYATDLGELVFEIYPGQLERPLSSDTRLGFQVGDLDDTLNDLRRHGVRIIKEKAPSSWGLRAVVEDFAGYRVELTERKTTCAD